MVSLLFAEASPLALPPQNKAGAFAPSRRQDCSVEMAKLPLASTEPGRDPLPRDKHHHPSNALALCLLRELRLSQMGEWQQREGK